MTADKWRVNERWEAAAAVTGGPVLATGLLVNREIWEGSSYGVSDAELVVGLAVAVATVAAGLFLTAHSLFGRVQSEGLRTFGIAAGGTGAGGFILGLSLMFSG